MLVGTEGTVDWYCYSRFDAPSVVVSILNDGFQAGIIGAAIIVGARC